MKNIKKLLTLIFLIVSTCTYSQFLPRGKAETDLSFFDSYIKMKGFSVDPNESVYFKIPDLEVSRGQIVSDKRILAIIIASESYSIDFKALIYYDDNNGIQKILKLEPFNSNSAVQYLIVNNTITNGSLRYIISNKSKALTYNGNYFLVKVYYK